MFNYSNTQTVGPYFHVLNPESPRNNKVDTLV